MRKIFVFVSIVILLANSRAVLAAETTSETVNGVITEVQKVETDSFPEYHLTIRILQGQYKDQYVEKVFTQVQFSQWDFTPEVGQTLVLRIAMTTSDFDVNIISLSRQGNLFILFLIFFASCLWTKKRVFVFGIIDRVRDHHLHILYPARVEGL